MRAETAQCITAPPPGEKTLDLADVRRLPKVIDALLQAGRARPDFPLDLSLYGECKTKVETRIESERRHSGVKDLHVEEEVKKHQNGIKMGLKRG